MIPIQFLNIEKVELKETKDNLPRVKNIKNNVLGIENYKIVKYYKPISKLYNE